ncbi:Beta-galactosidase BoGH2A [subsurface metagenome]
MAEGFDEEGNLVLTVVNETTGAPAGIDLKPDRQTMKADKKDLVVVNVSIVDEKGRVVPTAENLVVFSLEGPARILGVGNGNPISHEPDKSDRRRAFNGLCQVIVQSTWEAGGIILRAASRGLKPSEIRLSSGEEDQVP